MGNCLYKVFSNTTVKGAILFFHETSEWMNGLKKCYQILDLKKYWVVKGSNINFRLTIPLNIIQQKTAEKKRRKLRQLKRRWEMEKVWRVQYETKWGKTTVEGQKRNGERRGRWYGDRDGLSRWEWILPGGAAEDEYSHTLHTECFVWEPERRFVLVLYLSYACVLPSTINPCAKVTFTCFH